MAHLVVADVIGRPAAIVATTMYSIAHGHFDTPLRLSIARSYR